MNALKQACFFQNPIATPFYYLNFIIQSLNKSACMAVNKIVLEEMGEKSASRPAFKNAQCFSLHSLAVKIPPLRSVATRPGQAQRG